MIQHSNRDEYQQGGQEGPCYCPEAWYEEVMIIIGTIAVAIVVLLLVTVLEQSE